MNEYEYFDTIVDSPMYEYKRSVPVKHVQSILHTEYIAPPVVFLYV